MTTDGAVIEFQVALPPRALRVNSRSQVRGYRSALKRQYQEDVWCAGRESTVCAFVKAGTIPYESLRDGSLAKTPTLPWERARLMLTWKHAGVAPDADNALASLKPLIDVLHTRSDRPLGIIVDDSPAHLDIMPVVLEKVRHRADEGIVIHIQRMV